MQVVDTNVLLYAANEDSPFHLSCRKYLESVRRSTEPWYLTWPIVYEFMRVATHPRVFSKPWTTQNAWQFLGALMESRSLRFLVASDRHVAVLANFLERHKGVSGSLFHDAHTAVLMQEHGLRCIVTRDADFRRFRDLTVIDPADL